MNEFEEGIYTTKVIFLGDNGVGKTLILTSILNQKKSLPKNATIFSKIFDKNDGSGEKLKIDFWDTIKQENLNNIIPIYYKNAQVAIIVFDITNRISFEKLDEIMRKVKDLSNPSIIVFLVGNKKDLAINGNRVITEEEAEKFAKSIRAFYSEVSALNKEGINELINLIVSKVPKPSPDNQVHRIYRVQPLQTNFCSRITCGAR